MDNPAAGELALCGLPQAWPGLPAWTVLDAGMQGARRFLHTWLAWQSDPRRPRLLHYVAISPTASHWLAEADALPSHAQPKGWQACARQCETLDPGFHRLLLDDGKVTLTLCLGEARGLLGEHGFQADTLFAPQPDDKWAAQLLARRCKRGTRFCLHETASPVDGNRDAQRAAAAQVLQAQGFQLEQHAAQTGWLCGRFDPRWDISSSRSTSRQMQPAPSRCAIVGAGVAGAAAAHALALRGWQVSVFDQGCAPAAGASGLPAGLAVPHVSADDSPRSRLSRRGIRLLRQHAEQLLVRGQDWSPSGVLERRSDGSSLWHPEACWIKPAALVHAWLSQPGIHFTGGAQVAALEHADGHWHLRDDQGRALGAFALVLLANAVGCAKLLRDVPLDAAQAQDFGAKLAALHGVHGTLSHGRYAETIPGLPTTPVNGNGCFIPHVPGANGEDQWFAGSTFETDALAAADSWAQHTINMERLQHLLPEHGSELAHTLDRGPVAQWSATRCATHDRLPLVGPVEAAVSPGLWLCVGMGSRGLSFSALCAELLAARLGGEPWPVESSLARGLDVNRVRRKV